MKPSVTSPLFHPVLNTSPSSLRRKNNSSDVNTQPRDNPTQFFIERVKREVTPPQSNSTDLPLHNASSAESQPDYGHFRFEKNQTLFLNIEDDDSTPPTTGPSVSTMITDLFMNKTSSRDSTPSSPIYFGEDFDRDLASSNESNARDAQTVPTTPRVSTNPNFLDNTEEYPQYDGYFNSLEPCLIVVEKCEGKFAKQCVKKN